MKNLSLLIFVILLVLGCSKSDDPDEIVCSDEFRTIGLTVSGGRLSDFYTIRESTGDTIRFTGSGIYPLSRWYPILDDSYQEILYDTEEQFYFYGEIDGSRVVEELYIIGADACHIFKVTGKESVSIVP
jgi:hypothetical protein